MVSVRWQPATATYADIHPTGGISSMVLGHFIPLEAATTPEKNTLGRKIASRFRREGPIATSWSQRLRELTQQQNFCRLLVANHSSQHRWRLRVVAVVPAQDLR